MAPTKVRKARKSRAQYYTPPPDLVSYEGQAKNPQRARVLYAKLFSQALNVPIPSLLVQQIIGVAEHNQSQILKSKQARTLYNIVDKGPDPRGRKRAFLCSDTLAIAKYLDNDSVPLDDKGDPWLNIAEEVGVDLPQTFHFKPPGLQTVQTQTLQ
jgi:hypothetical protein